MIVDYMVMRVVRKLWI